jgi:hypothetical protein
MAKLALGVIILIWRDFPRKGQYSVPLILSLKGVFLAAFWAAALLWVGIPYCFITGACGARTGEILVGRVAPSRLPGGLTIDKLITPIYYCRGRGVFLRWL